MLSINPSRGFQLTSELYFDLQIELNEMMLYLIYRQRLLTEKCQLHILSHKSLWNFYLLNKIFPLKDMIHAPLQTKKKIYIAVTTSILYCLAKKSLSLYIYACTLNRGIVSEG
ncbi:hypothetical protein Cni_G25140 [Canna indica]|uniref:Uncharacterized protein n=1 Tax=Canna indica TaxID=4628 RepID=A0AAQ3KWJ7_9LILI|nr:hypothetical protein Cni_G25140 [Canna indica]